MEPCPEELFAKIQRLLAEPAVDPALLVALREAARETDPQISRRRQVELFKQVRDQALATRDELDCQRARFADPGIAEHLAGPGADPTMEQTRLQRVKELRKGADAAVSRAMAAIAGRAEPETDGASASLGSKPRPRTNWMEV